MEYTAVTPIFIGGCPRSGTTFLADLLGSACPSVVTPESQFKTDVIRDLRSDTISSATFRDQIRAHWRFKHWSISLNDTEDDRCLDTYESYGEAILEIVEAYARTRGIAQFAYWIDHTPTNLHHAQQLMRMFPQAKFLHLIRDPRAVINSVLQVEWGPHTLRDAAQWWLRNIAYGLVLELRHPERCLQVRYEDVVRDPKGTIREIFDEMSVAGSADDAVGGAFELPPYTREQHQLVGGAPEVSRIDRWRRTLSPRQIEIIEYELKSVLPNLGYVNVYDHPQRMIPRERWLQRLQGAILHIVNGVRRRLRRM